MAYKCISIRRVYSFSGDDYSLMAERERLEHHSGCSGPRPFLFESLLVSTASSYVDMEARLVNDEVAADCSLPTDVSISASGSLESDLQSIVELLRATVLVGRVFTANTKTSGTPSSLLLVPDID